jgi:anti-sigma regulatory factor (Ser/Thr protein kinase)
MVSEVGSPPCRRREGALPRRWVEGLRDEVGHQCGGSDSVCCTDGAGSSRDSTRVVVEMRWYMARDDSPDPVSEEFTLHGLRYVRDLVSRVAGLAGIPVRGIDDLVWAVNEITTNAIVHGGGRGCITLTATGSGVRVAVTDWGPGLAGSIADDGPPSNAPGGRGLWLARKLYPQMTVTTSPAGTTVTVYAAR